MNSIVHVRLPDEQRGILKEIAALNHNTPSGVIRLAVDRLLAEAQRCGGALPVIPSPAFPTQRIRSARSKD